jgi:hypothetical protein
MVGGSAGVEFDHSMLLQPPSLAPNPNESIAILDNQVVPLFFSEWQQNDFVDFE